MANQALNVERELSRIAIRTCAHLERAMAFGRAQIDAAEDHATRMYAEGEACGYLRALRDLGRIDARQLAEGTLQLQAWSDAASARLFAQERKARGVAA